jgi:AcrR family transcriptional regulator
MSTTTSPSRRVPRRRRTAHRAAANGLSSRAAILAATEELLLAEGVEGMSIRKVTDRCGYTAPTIYHHFGDKAGLVSTIVEERFRRILELMSSIPRGHDAAGYLREMARAFVAFALANPDHYRLLSVPGLDPAAVPSAEAARSLVKRALEELARAGTLGTSDIEAAYQTTWAILHGLISLRLQRPDYPFSDQMIELAFDVIEGGLLRRAPAARSGSSHE